MYKALGRLLSAMNLCASLLTLLMMAFIGADVAGRAFFGAPVYGVPELTKLGVVCIVWLQMTYTLHARKHLRAETFLMAMPRPAQRTIAFANAVLGALVFAVIAYTASSELSRSWINGTFEGEHPMRIPVWPVWLVLVIGAGMTALEYAVQAGQAVGLGTYRDTLPELDKPE